MRQAQHTPGPWQAGMTCDIFGVTCFSVLSHTHTAISACLDLWPEGYSPQTDEDGYCQPDEFLLCEQRHVANARLIAAAPELLGALKNLRAEFGKTEPDFSAVDAADAAIAKALGEPHGAA